MLGEKFKDLYQISTRHDELMDLMVRIIKNSNSLNLSKETDFKLLNLAYDNVYELIANKSLNCLTLDFYNLTLNFFIFY